MRWIYKREPHDSESGWAALGPVVIRKVKKVYILSADYNSFVLAPPVYYKHIYQALTYLNPAQLINEMVVMFACKSCYELHKPKERYRACEPFIFPTGAAQ